MDELMHLQETVESSPIVTSIPKCLQHYLDIYNLTGFFTVCFFEDQSKVQYRTSIGENLSIMHHPSILVPGRPAANYEASVSLPAYSDHRRNRHAPLLHTAEWMEATYHQNNSSQSLNDIPVIFSEEEAELSPKTATEIYEPMTARKRRGLYDPQALRREISVGKSNTTETQYHLFLRQLGTALDCDTHVPEDDEVPRIDSPTLPLMTADGDNEHFPNLFEHTPEAQPNAMPAYKICNAVTMTITPFPKRTPNTTHNPRTKPTPTPLNLSKSLPPLPLSATSPITPSSQSPPKPIPTSISTPLTPPPSAPLTSSQVMTCVSKGDGNPQPRIDFGPVSKLTALGSHRPSDDEREHSRWLAEGWRVARERRVEGGQGRRKGCRVQGFVKPLRKGITGCFGYM